MTEKRPQKLCKATTVKGTPCPFRAKLGSDYCGHHVEEQQKIRNFLQEHREGVLSFLAGAITDPISSDIYDWVKERLKMQHLVPPVRARNAEDERISFLASNYPPDQGLEKICKRIPFLRIGMKVDQVTAILGQPSSSNWRMEAIGRAGGGHIDIQRGTHIYYLDALNDKHNSMVIEFRGNTAYSFSLDLRNAW